jgi:hypothetical protein
MTAEQALIDLHRTWACRYLHARCNTHMNATPVSKAVNLLEEVGRFAGHVVAATVMFGLVALVATGLHLAVVWMTSVKLDDLIIRALSFLEFLIFGSDVLVFSVWVLISTIGAVISLWKNRGW